MRVDRLIGVPYRDRGRDPQTGLDCWGLVLAAQREIFGRDLSRHEIPYACATALPSASAALLAGAQDETLWAPVETVRPGDVVTLRVLGWVAHCGVMIDWRTMLHTMLGHDSCLERVDSSKWGGRVAGYYRPR